MKYYAGIGNRDIDVDIYYLIERIASKMAEFGYTLRSGGAQGCDKAFAEGALWDKQIFLADDCTQDSMNVAKQFHPAWHNCSDYARKLHARNSLIILGADLKQPVERVICYAKNENSGGTALGIKIARHYNIPVMNLANKKVRNKFEEILV